MPPDLKLGDLYQIHCFENEVNHAIILNPLSHIHRKQHACFTINVYQGYGVACYSVACPMSNPTGS